MSDPVSFFYRRDRIPSYTYAFTLTVAGTKETFRFFVCSNERLRGPLIKDGPLPSADQQENCAADLRKALAAQGGLFLVLAESEKRWTVRFHIVESPSSKPAPKTFLEVELGRPPRIRQIEASEQSVPVGCHLVVPIDDKSEEQLVVFRDSLSWLPEDLEAVVLCALVRPSLEERMSRLEKGLADRAVIVRKRAHRRRGILSSLADWWFLLRKPVLLGCLVLILVGGFVALDRRLRGADKDESPVLASNNPGVAETASASSATAEVAAEDGARVDFAKSVDEVLEAVREKGARLPAFKALYDRHFAAYAGSSDKQAELARILSGDSGNELLLGLIKLQIVQLNQSMWDFTFLTRADNLDQTERVAQSIIDPNRAADGPNQNMIAALSCIGWKMPGLGGGTVFGPSNRPCADYNLLKALPGVKALPKFVNDFMPARRPSAGSGNNGTRPAPDGATPNLPESLVPEVSPEPTESPAGGGGQ